MEPVNLEERLILNWLQAARNLGVRVTAPIELLDAAGQPFVCEALVHDFGSPSGAVVVSPKTERRIRRHLRSLGDNVWVSMSEQRLQSYKRAHFIEELVDWAWFGEAGAQPEWYSERMPHSG